MKTLHDIINCILRWPRYLSKRQAYYEATAKNLEMAANNVAAASDEVVRRSRREETRSNAQRRRIDTLSRLLERTKTFNEHPPQ